MDGELQVSVPLASLYNVAFVDSAGGRVGSQGRAKSQRSRSAIVVIGQDTLSRVFIRKAWARHCTTDELIFEIFGTQKVFMPSVFGIDAGGNQGLFADALILRARELGKKLPISKVPMETDKDFRIETTIQPLQSAGKLFAMPDQIDLKGEYEAFPGSRFKDILDALSGAIKLLPTRATKDQAVEEIEEYRRYLESQRVSPEEIERRIEDAFASSERENRI